MRYILSLLLFFSIATRANAQDDWYLSTSVGFNITGFEFYGPYPPDPVNAPGSLIGLQLHKELGKYFDAGISVTTGTLHPNVTMKIVRYSSNHTPQTIGSSAELDVLTPYVAPVLFGHFRLDMGKNSCLYAGPAVGMITGGNSANLKHNLTTGLYGADLGVSLGLNEHVRLTLNESWRIARLKLEDVSTRTVQLLSGPDYSVNSFQDMLLNYFSFSVGLSVKL